MKTFLLHREAHASTGCAAVLAIVCCLRFFYSTLVRLLASTARDACDFAVSAVLHWTDNINIRFVCLLLMLCLAAKHYSYRADASAIAPAFTGQSLHVTVQGDLN